MQGVRSSSLLGSIPKEPSLWLGSFIADARRESRSMLRVGAKHETLQALGAYLAKGAGLGT